MPKVNQKGSPRFAGEAGVAHILVLIILLTGLGVGFYLVQHPAIFNPKAQELQQGGAPVCQQIVTEFTVRDACEYPDRFRSIEYSCGTGRRLTQGYGSSCKSIAEWAEVANITCSLECTAFPGPSSPPVSSPTPGPSCKPFVEPYPAPQDCFWTIINCNGEGRIACHIPEPSSQPISEACGVHIWANGIMDANSIVVAKPGPVELSWTSDFDVDGRLFAEGNWGPGDVSTKGSETVYPQSEGNFTYSLTCGGKDSKATSSVNVYVGGPTLIPAPSDCNLLQQWFGQCN